MGLDVARFITIPANDSSQAYERPPSTKWDIDYFVVRGADGILAPAGGAFLLLNSSHICSKVTHSTPSCLLICSIILDNMSILAYPW